MEDLTGEYKEEISISNLMYDVSDTLVQSQSYGLTTEVFATAFAYLKQNPDKSVAEALDYGYSEWIK